MPFLFFVSFSEECRTGVLGIYIYHSKEEENETCVQCFDILEHRYNPNFYKASLIFICHSFLIYLQSPEEEDFEEKERKVRREKHIDVCNTLKQELCCSNLPVKGCKLDYNTYFMGVSSTLFLQVHGYDL